MATQTPPPPRKLSEKGEPPSLRQTKANLAAPASEELANLNFKVSAEFKRDFKVAAAQKGVTQVELLREVFDYWNRNNS
jgi:hypothetical protein